MEKSESLLVNKASNLPATNKKLISIVIPCYNEEKNINKTFDGLLEISKNSNNKFEIITVNDGSKDKTWEVIKEYAGKYEEIKGINLMGNFGQSCAYIWF